MDVTWKDEVFMLSKKALLSVGIIWYLVRAYEWVVSGIAR